MSRRPGKRCHWPQAIPWSLSLGRHRSAIARWPWFPLLLRGRLQALPPPLWTALTCRRFSISRCRPGSRQARRGLLLPVGQLRPRQCPRPRVLLHPSPCRPWLVPPFTSESLQAPRRVGLSASSSIGSRRSRGVMTGPFGTGRSAVPGCTCQCPPLCRRGVNTGWQRFEAPAKGRSSGRYALPRGPIQRGRSTVVLVGRR